MSEATPFKKLAMLLKELEATSKRREKIRLIGSFLSELQDDEVSPAVCFITGRVFPESDPRVLEVGERTVWKIAEMGKQSVLIETPLTILSVYRRMEELAAISGKGSRAKKESILSSLFSQATPDEAEYLVRILFGEMRIGAVEGVMLEAISEAAQVDLELVRRSHMFIGDLGRVAIIALKKGEEGLRRVDIQLFNPIKPMLAEMSYDLAEVFREHGGKTALEFKFDGARVQIHKKGQVVRIFSRGLTDVTSSLPDISGLIQSHVYVDEALLEGEVIALGDDGRPLPFQDLMRRFRRVHDIPEMIKKMPFRLYLFDVVYIDGQSLVEAPYQKRWELLAKVTEPSLVAERTVTDDVAEAEAFMDRALKSGFEGLMAKALDSDYTPGVRGKKWFKIKPADYLDLVIIAAERGHGRRTGWLSNYHLAARNEATGEFLMLGKTFKGLTDDEFREMTERLRRLRIHDDGYTVWVRPGIVVEVAYNEIQRSPHYKSGFALRFARITRIRDDKAPEDADTIERVRKLYERQFDYKAKKLFD